jgi:hypothetical protein
MIYQIGPWVKELRAFRPCRQAWRRLGADRRAAPGPAKPVDMFRGNAVRFLPGNGCAARSDASKQGDTGRIEW